MPGIMESKLRYVLYENEGAFLAQCLDVDIASVGDSEDEAIAALKEALELYFLAGAAPASAPKSMCFGEIEICAQTLLN